MKNYFKILSALFVLFVLSCAYVSAETTYTNGFKDGGQKTDADYYEEPELVDGVYQIANAGNLWWLANSVNSNQKTAATIMPGDEVKAKAVLTADINMEGSTRGSFPGIGYRATYWDGSSYKADGTTKITSVVGLFTGSFDGQGYSISNFYQSNSSNYKALINTTGNGATIKNFTISGEVAISGGMQMGAIVGRIEGKTTLENIHSSVNFTVADGKTISAIGGIVGQSSGQTIINSCRYSGTITGKSSFNALGGIIGNAEANLTFNNCLFDGAITTTSTQARTGVDNGIKIGSMCSRNNNVSTITNCLSIGTISVPSAADKGNVGIILGTQTSNNKLTITNTYYKTTNCTEGIGAVGNNSNTDKTSANPTEITTQTWKEIKTALNNGSANWGINSQVYPVPGDVDATQYTVTYNSNGGPTYSSVTKAVNTVITLPSPTMSGYLFTGWDTLESGTGTRYQGGASYTITDDVTLYAQWVLAYTITFKANGGSACAAVTKAVNTVITLPTPTKTGYLFNGWNTKEDGSSTSYAGGASYTITANATLYAQWTEDEVGDYRNGFKKTGSKSDADYYQAPELITAERCSALGIASTYATSGYYEVRNAGNMFWIANNLSADNNTRKYVMTDNINMAGDDANHKDWPGIGAWGSADKHFKGTFDGLGHKFSNYYMKVSSGSIKGMFCVPNGATIKDFSIDGELYIASGDTQMGVIAGRIAEKTTFEKIHSSVNITIAAGMTPKSIGGLVGQCSANTTFNLCRYSGTITANSASSSVGGIFGNTEAEVTMNNCLFDGSIISTSNQEFLFNAYGGAANGVAIGGLGGVTNRKLTINNSMSVGTISIEQAEDKNHSGIILGVNGLANKLTIANTYYRTTGSTSGLNAVGLNNAADADQSAAAPIEINSQTWPEIKAALNNGSHNWGLNTREYPVPGETDATQYTISFNSNGGSAVASITQSAGTAVTAPANPTRAGYTFAGWNPTVPAIMPASNTQCVAQWYVTITFNTDGGSAIDPITQAAGTAVTAPANPTKTGYTFAGWSQTIPTEMPNQNVTITAQWTVNQYTITFDSNGGSAVAPITQDYGTAITKPANPTKQSWTFNGWNPAIPITMPAENITCKAQWIQESYDANGFNTNASCAADVKYRKPAGSGTAEDPYLIGNGGNLWWFATQVKTTDKTLCAKLTANINAECNTRVTGVGANMPQMGEWGAPYTGTFDGQGYTISNWKQIWSTDSRSGLFGYTTNATIRNFTLEGEMTVSIQQQHASIVGYAGAGTLVEDVWSKVNIAANGTVFCVGGVVGRQNGTINRCRYSGTITCAAGVYIGIGGIVGETYGGLTNNCLFDGTIIAPSNDQNLRLGGIVGYQSEAGASTVKNCFVNGTITVANYSTTTSGVVIGGNTNQIYVYNMYYTRTNVSASLNRAAGIYTKSAMGHCEDVTGEACLANGTLRDLLGNGNWMQDNTLGYPVPHKGTATAGLDANGFSYARDGQHDVVTLNKGWYEIANGGQLFDFAEKIAAGTIASTSKAKLTADVDLEWCDFPGIGVYNGGTKKFQGTFDGKGHTISGMCRTLLGGMQGQGLFNHAENATIQDFTVEGEIQVHEGSGNTYFIGGVVGLASAGVNLEDVTSSVDINVIKGSTETRIIGGIVGRLKGTMDRCRYNGTMDLGTIVGQQIGGVLASANGATMTNCLFDGTILAATSNTTASKVVIGGLLGIDTDKVTIAECLSNGTITLSDANASTTNVGAVWGNITKTTSASTVTYYTTSGITRAGAALNQEGGANAAGDKMQTTTVGSTSWADIRVALGDTNWNFATGAGAKEYPIPAVSVHEHVYGATGWCYCNERKPLEQDEEGTYLIDCLAQFASFRDLVNNSAGAELNAKLTNDMDFSLFPTYLGNPIGLNKANYYYGTFDGQGHKIKDIHIESSQQYVGLFGVVGKDEVGKAATVKNFTISGTIKTTFVATTASNCSQAHMGVVGSLLNGTVENITSEIAYTNEGCTAAQFGGVVGCTLGSTTTKTIKDCKFTGSITVDAWDCLAGIIGYTQGNITLERNFFGGSVISSTCTAGKTTKMGGIVGYAGVDGRAFVVSTNVSNGTLTPPETGTVNVGALYGGSSAKNGTYSNNYAASVGDKDSDKGKITADDSFASATAANYLNLISSASGNIITQSDAGDEKMNYHLKVLNLDDLADAPTWPADAKSVKANQVIYSRAGKYMTNGFISVCMPFALDENTLPGGSECKVKVFDKVENNVVYFKDAEKEDGVYPAGVPYFLYLPVSARGKEWRVEITAAEGYNLEMAPVNPAQGGIQGSFVTTKTGAWANSNQLYKLNSAGDALLKTGAKSSCYPYRAYLKIPTSQSNSAGSYRLSFEDFDEGGITSLSDLQQDEAESAPYYNLQGQQVDARAKGLLIHQGKIRIVK